MTAYNMEMIDDMDRITIRLQVSNSIGVQTGTLKIHKEATLSELKEEIYSKLEVPVEKQSLEIDGINFNEADKTTILADLGINAKSVIKLSRLDGEEVILDPSMSELTPAANIRETQSGSGSGSGGARVVNQGVDIVDNNLHAIGFVEPIIDPNVLAQTQADIIAIESNVASSQLNMDVVNSLLRWSLIQCRCIVIFMVLCVFLFGLRWGDLDMLYYIFALICGMIGWVGCRRLAIPCIVVLLFFLLIDLIVLISRLGGSEEKNSNALVFLRVIEGIIICIWSGFLWRFIWIISRSRDISPFSVNYATERCRDALICV